jgi:hypothetical protein
VSYKFRKDHRDLETSEIQKEIADNFFSKDKNGNLVLSKDIYCRDLITEASSIYIGSRKKENKLENIKTNLYFNGQQITETSSSGTTVLVGHEARHRSGGEDALDHDNLAGFVADEHKSSAYNIAMSVALGMP